MKKKRGFTLVELLAVLVIIAVILLLITPQILKKINDSKSSLYDTQMEEIKKAARVYMSNLNIDNTMTISLGELKKAGLVDKDIKDPTTGELLDDCLLVTVTKVEENYMYTIDDKTNLNCKKSEKYTLILIGNSTVEVSKGKKYNEDGVLLKSNKENYIDPKDVEVTIRKNGTIITPIPLKYENYIKETENYITTESALDYQIIYTYKEEDEESSVTRIVRIKETSNVNLSKPVFNIQPIGWSLSKTIDVNFNQNGTYLIQSSMPLSSNDDLIECINSIRELYNCNGIQTNSVNPLKWYKFNQGNKFNSIENGNIIAKITDGIKYETSSTAITTIDRTPPITPTISTTTSNNGTITVNYNSSDPESGIFGYQVSIDGGITWSEVITTTSKQFTNLAGGTYNVIVKAINTTYDGQTVGKTTINELNSSISVMEQVTIVVNPSVTIKSTTSLSDRINVKYNIKDANDFIFEYWKGNETHKVVEHSNTCTMEECIITGLKSNTTYNVKVTAINNGNTPEDTSDDIEVTDTAQPTTSLVPSPSISSVTTWKKTTQDVTITYYSNNVQTPSYYFYIENHTTPTIDHITANVKVYSCGNSHVNSCTTEKAAGTDLTTGWYKAQTSSVKLTYDREYEYIFKAITKDESLNSSALASGTRAHIDKTNPIVSATATATENSITITPTTSDQLTDRNAVGSGIATYEYYYGTSSASLSKVSSCTTSSCVITGLASNTKYYYKVRVIDGVGLDAETPIQEIVTTQSCTPLYTNCGECQQGNFKYCRDSSGCTSTPITQYCVYSPPEYTVVCNLSVPTSGMSITPRWDNAGGTATQKYSQSELLAMCASTYSSVPYQYGYQVICGGTSAGEQGGTVVDTVYVGSGSAPIGQTTTVNYTAPTSGPETCQQWNSSPSRRAILTPSTDQFSFKIN